MEELDSLENSMVPGMFTHPWGNDPNLATWFHSSILQRTQTFAIAIVRTGCHFNGFFPIAGICPQSRKAKWWKICKGNQEVVHPSFLSSAPWFWHQLTALDTVKHSHNTLNWVCTAASQPPALISFLTGARSIHSLGKWSQCVLSWNWGQRLSNSFPTPKTTLCDWY